MTEKHHDHPRRIELKLHDISQLFNSMDPSPFHEKDLDADAEEFIVSWAQEYPLDAPLALRIHLAQWPAADPRDLVRQSIHHYFDYRANLTQLEFGRLMDQGRKSMVIGLAFLAACFLAIELLLPLGDGTWARFLREGLLIAGWVAMWRPMQTYLYDWWPLRRRQRIFAKLSKMPVDVIHKE
ncbi:MAG TPA: hypothetical protein VGA88_09625 [Burkholderiales bacterium]|jgi:hypothetical protein